MKRSCANERKPGCVGLIIGMNTIGTWPWQPSVEVFEVRETGRCFQSVDFLFKVLLDQLVSQWG